jgi:hypothetical protein
VKEKGMDRYHKSEEEGKDIGNVKKELLKLPNDWV